MVVRSFLRGKQVKGEVGLDTWNCGSTEEWLRKYKILSRDMDEAVGTSQLCWNNSSSSLQRRSWLSMVFNKVSLEHKRNLLWLRQHILTKDNCSSMLLLCCCPKCRCGVTAGITQPCHGRMTTRCGERPLLCSLAMAVFSSSGVTSNS